MIAVSLTWKLCTSAVDIRTCAEIKKIKIFFSPYLTEEQSISKWESDIAYPETEKLIELGKLFDCSMDYLMKEEVIEKGDVQTSIFTEISRKVVNPKNKDKSKKLLKIIGIILAVVLVIDIVSMILYFCILGIPR